MGALEELAKALILENESPDFSKGDAYKDFGGIADYLGQNILQNRDQYGTKNAMAGALITGMLGGGLDTMSRDYQNEQKDLYRKALIGNMLGDGTQPEDLEDSLFDVAKQKSGALKVLDLAETVDTQNKQNIENKKVIISELAKADTPFAQQRVLEAGKALGLIPKDMTLGDTEAEPLVTSPSETEDIGPKLGVPNLQEIEDAAFQRKIKAGQPAIQASVSAKAEAEDRRKRSRDLISGKLKEEQESIGAAEDIIRKGEEGIEKAGVTGSNLASAYESTASWISGLLGGGVFPEAEKQATGDTNLKLTQNLGAMLNRIKGSGALSDFESKALFETAMSPTKTKPENEAILRGYKNGLAIMKEHNDFLNYFSEQTGGNPDRAQTLWEIYKKENPILVQDKQGNFVINDKKTPWQKFDFEKAYSGFMSGESPSIAPVSTPTTNTVPQVGSTFNGEKVLSVRKVR